ncbi:G domain-containing protein [Fusarium falciforme]|nr:G domain-containing protein [Fusarium falciforme]WAO91178.1 G domain-containing protein [Fusarium falciforme]
MITYQRQRMEQNKIYIAVMGVTGSGKSTFIKTATGIQDIAIGEDMLSCTSRVVPYRFKLDGHEVVLIDTPGFNDSLRSESEILKNIANWLDYSFRNPPRIKLSGIIYMQAITDRKMYGSSLRNLKMFKELCGENPLRNVVFTTSGWGAVRLTGGYHKAVAHERQLCEAPEFWKNLIKRNARVARFEDSPESAIAIIRTLMGQKPLTLQIQAELVEQNRNLVDTRAGNVVDEELKALEEKYKDQLAQVQREMREAIEAKDVEIQESLEVSRAEIMKLRDSARRAHDDLHYKSRNDARAAQSLRVELREMRSNMERMRDSQDKRYEETLDRQKQEYEDAAMRLKAERIEQQMQFQGVVDQLRANQSRIREEERTFLEARIAELESRKIGKGSTTELLTALAGTLGNVAMIALGFPSLFGAESFSDMF